MPTRPTAQLENGPSIPLASAERIACAARVRALVKDRRGNPLYLGRTRPSVSVTSTDAVGPAAPNPVISTPTTATAITGSSITPTWAGERLDPTPILALLLPDYLGAAAA